MSDSKLRPEVNRNDAKPGSFCPKGGTAYLMVYNAVQSKDRLIHGRLHHFGESCAIGSYWDVNPKCALDVAIIDEVAAVNDSVPNASASQRRRVVLRWLKWKLGTLGMPGFLAAAKQSSKQAI